MQDSTEFLIKDISVVCPACEYAFATPNLDSMPNITADSPIEADLHRVLPDPAIRGALIAVCPACTYAWWLSAFASHHFVPDLLVPAPPVEFSKKFGVAVVSGRKRKEPLLDMALLAINGYWCAREEVATGSGNASEIQRWLKLAVKELKTAMEDASWQANTSRYSYLLGELYRQMGDFHSAVNYLQVVDRRSMLPRELVDHQISLAKAGSAEPILMPPRLVDAVFGLTPPVVELPEPTLVEMA